MRNASPPRRAPSRRDVGTSRKHCRVRRRFIAISLDFHATSYADNGLAARQARYVDKCVVEGSVDVRYAEYDFALTNRRAECDRCFYLFLDFWGHRDASKTL